MVASTHAGLAAHLARVWAERRLPRGQCEVCRTVLPDVGGPIDGWRVCSEDCYEVACVIALNWPQY